MIRITYFRHKCIGCNACVEAAPQRWRMSKKDGRCILIDGTENNGVYTALINPDERQENEIAADNCPVSIIQIGP